MTKQLERRYHKKPNADGSAMIGVFFAMFVYQFIQNFVIDVVPLDKWLIYIIGFFIPLPFLFFIHFLIKKFVFPHLKKTQLLITNKTITKGYKDQETLVLWHKNLQVLQITDLKNSALVSIKKEMVSEQDTAFLIIDKSYHSERVQLVISTLDWHIDDSKDLQQFFADIGYPVQPISAEESNKYFSELQQADLGNKAGACAMLSIVCCLIGIAILQYDDYRTLDFGIWRHVVVVVFLLIATAVFKWIYQEEKNTWQFQLVVAGLFSMTFTAMLFALLLKSSVWFGAQQMADFQYVGYDRTQGVLWQQVNPPNFEVNCGDKTTHDKNNNENTIRQATIIHTLGMIRVQQKEICLE